MKRTVLAVAALLMTSSAVRAETIPLIEDVPAAYTPGTPFSFFVRVPQVADFTGYSVELIFSTDVLNPPLDVAAAPPGTNYPFPSSAGFDFGVGRVLDSNLVYLTFSDATSPGVLALPGANDTLAQVIVTPGADLTGPIIILVGQTLFEINTEGTGGLQPPDPVVVEQGEVGTPPPTPVPAPPALALASAGVLVLLARARVTRR